MPQMYIPPGYQLDQLTAADFEPLWLLPWNDVRPADLREPQVERAAWSYYLCRKAADKALITPQGP